MSQPHIPFNDGTSAPWLAFGTGTAKQDAANSVCSAIETGIRHLDGTQLYNNEDTLGDGIKAGGSDAGRSTSTINPHDSVSNVPSQETTALSRLACSNLDFERYLTAAQCVYDLDNLLSDQDPKSENTKQIKQILGDLPEKPSSSDFSLLYVAQRWELFAAMFAPLSMLNKEQEQALQRETGELYRTWELSQFYPDLEVIRERLKPAALITARPQIVDVETWLPTPGPMIYLEVFKMLLCTDSPRLQHGADTMKIVHLTLPWGTISQQWQPGIAERHLRIPLDMLYTTIFGGLTFIERGTIPVSAKSRIDKGPGNYFFADQYKTHSFIIKEFLPTDRILLDLLQWCWNTVSPAQSGLVEIPLLAQEFEIDNSREAANQCAADLITGATINELLDIQFPCYGLVVTLEECSLYAARAQLQPDGTLKYAVQKIDVWGTLKELHNYLRYVKFVEDHKAWFEDNIVSKLINKRNEEDPGWVIQKLSRAYIKPWGNEGNTSPSSVLAVSLLPQSDADYHLSPLQSNLEGNNRDGNSSSCIDGSCGDEGDGGKNKKNLRLLHDSPRVESDIGNKNLVH